MIKIDSPKEHQSFKVGQPITFSGTANGGVAQVSLMSPFNDDIVPLAVVTVQGGKWKFIRPFTTPGQRAVVADGLDSAGRDIDDEQATRLFVVKATFGKPFTVPAQLTDIYGFRPRRGRFHHGVDLIPSSGRGTAEIVAVADGTVIDVENSCQVGNELCGSGYGNLVFIRHDAQGLISRYCHLASTRVKIRDKVTQGQVVGMMGETGAAQGIHLHFELRRISDGASVDPQLHIRPIE